jgi:hypothetical protein
MPTGRLSIQLSGIPRLIIGRGRTCCNDMILFHHPAVNYLVSLVTKKENLKMSKNTKQSTPKVAALAAATLNDKNASQIAKSLAGSVIAQTHTGKQTGADMESKASKVLQSEKYSDETKTLAASVLSQSNKER